MATYTAFRTDKNGVEWYRSTADTVAMTLTEVVNGVTTVTPLDPRTAARIENEQRRDAREQTFHQQIATLKTWAAEAKALTMTGMTLAQNNTSTQLHIRRLGQVLDRLADLVEEKFD